MATRRYALKNRTYALNNGGYPLHPVRVQKNPPPRTDTYGHPIPRDPITGGGKTQQRGPKGPTREQSLNSAMSELRNALMSKGYTPQLAMHYARVALSRPNVSVGQRNVYIGDRKFKPAELANTQLVDLITGKVAARKNQNMLTHEAGYQQAMLNLGLQRDLALSPLEQQRRQAILDFGDSSYATPADTGLGAAAAANPYSTTRLLAQQHDANQRALTARSAQMGTLWGGAQVANTNRENSGYAARQFEATKSLSDLLNGYTQQKLGVERGYSVGQASELMAARQRLLEQGQLDPYKQPSYGVGKYHFVNFPKPRTSKKIRFSVVNGG